MDNYMITDRALRRSMESLIKRLNMGVELLDESGRVLSSNQDTADQVRRIHELNWDNNCSITSDGVTYVRLSAEHGGYYVLAIYGEGQQAEDYASMLSALAAMSVKQTQYVDQEELVRQLILDNVNEVEVQLYARELKLDLNCERCVMAFITGARDGGGAYEVLGNAFSRSDGDIHLPIDRHLIILVRRVNAEEDKEDLHQLTEALLDSIHQETGVPVVIGVGGVADTLLGIRNSYHEAIEAINAGMLQHPDRRVHIFQDMPLERFIYQVPRQTGKEFFRSVLPKTLPELFNDEMMITIDAFFERSLNISETARKLYIHRNTLVYRLDKVQRITGLDLRKFDDAVTFKMLLMIGRSLEQQSKQEG